MDFEKHHSALHRPESLLLHSGHLQSRQSPRQEHSQLEEGLAQEGAHGVSRAELI